MPVEHRFIFESVRPQHLALLRTWFHMPHVVEWWHGYADKVREIELGNQDDNIETYIAYRNSEPLAYIQSWAPTNNDDYPWQNDLSPDVRGIDLFIGPPDQLNKGLGPELVQAFAAKLRTEGASRVLIDPNVKNSRAIRAYEKVGFVPMGIVKDCDGESLLMEFRL